MILPKAKFLMMVLSITYCLQAMDKPMEAAKPASPAALTFEELSNLNLANLLEHANNNNPVAQYLVAECFLERKKGVERSEPMAIEWLERSAAGGYIYAAYRRGFIALNASKLKYDMPGFALAERYLKQAADGFEFLSMDQLSLTYKPQNKWGRPPSLEQEMGWLRRIIQDVQPDQSLQDEAYAKAVRKAKTKAAVRLGELCEKGYDIVPPCIADAVQYYAKALTFSPDDVRAKESLARLRQDPESFKALLKKDMHIDPAATDARTQCLLGKKAYDSGQFSAAVECFKKVVADAEAQYYLGLCCAGGSGTDKDTKNALAYFRESAEQGHAPAIAKLQSIPDTDPMYPAVQCVFGILHRRGKGLEKNDQLAVELFISSHKGKCGEAIVELRNMAQTSAEAQYGLGMLYETGQLGEPAIDEALAWYQKALLQNHESAERALERLANNNNAKAILILARHLENKREYQKCREWLEKGVLGTSAEAALELALIYSAGRHGEADEEQAVEWYAQAAELHSAPAIAKLMELAQTEKAYIRHKMGVLYENGKAFQRDLNAARTWYTRATVLKHGPAFYRLAELQESLPITVFKTPEEEEIVKRFKTPEEIVKCYVECQQLYNAALECKFDAAREDLDRLREIEQGITQVNILRGQKELGKIDFRNILFTKLRAELSADTSYEMCFWVAHICSILTQFYTPIMRDAVCVGIKKISEFCTLFGRKDRLASVFLQRIAEALLSDEFLKNPLNEKDEGLRIANIFTLCRSAAVLQRDSKDICTKEHFRRTEGATQDILIDVFNKYLLGEQKIQEKDYRTAVAALLVLYRSLSAKMTRAMLWDDEYERLADISCFEKLLTYGKTDRYKQRIVKIHSYIKDRLDSDTMAAQFASWAVAGIHCDTRAERETLEFVVANATNSATMDSQRFGLEMRIAVCLAEGRRKCIHALVPANTNERGHQLACLEKKVSKQLSLIGDAENFKDGFASITLLACYRNMTPEFLIDHVLKNYDEVKTLMEEINKKTDSTITYKTIYAHFEQFLGDANAAELVAQLYNEDGLLTERGAQILLYYFGYFE